MAFVLADCKFLFSATNCQRVLDTRVRQQLVYPGSVEVEMDETGLVHKCRVQVVTSRGLYADLLREYSLVSVPKLTAAWDAFRKRVDLTGYRRKVDLDHKRMVVQNLQTLQTYATTLGNCDCGSFLSQIEHRHYLSRYIPDFEPACKHTQFLRLVETASDGTTIFWTESSKDQTKVDLHIWPGAADLNSPATGKICKSGQISFYGTYPAERLAELHEVSINRGWKFSHYEPYGIPFLHQTVRVAARN